MDEHSVKEDILNILRILSRESNPTQREISSHLNISLGKTNYLLKELVKKGMVKIKSFSSGDDKLRKARYIITRRGFIEKVKLTRFFLEKKEKEYQELRKEWKRISMTISLTNQKG